MQTLFYKTLKCAHRPGQLNFYYTKGLFAPLMHLAVSPLVCFIEADFIWNTKAQKLEGKASTEEPYLVSVWNLKMRGCVWYNRNNIKRVLWGTELLVIFKSKQV